MTKARAAGVTVVFAVDFKRTQSNAAQAQAVLTLVCMGVKVIGLSGQDIRKEYEEDGRGRVFPAEGICHVKRIRLGPYCLLGSTNWTTSSRCNIEQSFLVKFSREEERKQYELEKLWFEHGREITEPMLRSWQMSLEDSKRSRSASRCRR